MRYTCLGGCDVPMVRSGAIGEFLMRFQKELVIVVMKSDKYGRTRSSCSCEMRESLECPVIILAARF